MALLRLIFILETRNFTIIFYNNILKFFIKSLFLDIFRDVSLNFMVP